MAPPTAVIIVRLTGDPRATLLRAVDREGLAWLDWYVSKLRRSPGTRHVTTWTPPPSTFEPKPS